MEGLPYVWDEVKCKMGIRIQRNSIPDYLTDDFREAVQMWQDWKTFGFSESGGTNDQPALWMDIIRLIESCARKMKGE